MNEIELDWQDYDNIATFAWRLFPFILAYAIINQYFLLIDPSFVITHTALGVTVAMTIFCEGMKMLSTDWQKLVTITFGGIEDAN